MQVGDRVCRAPTCGERGPALPPTRGRILYIHPERRYYTVEFYMPRGRKFRESYLIGRGNAQERIQTNENNIHRESERRRR
nr:MAG TPA: hypothetical protein [Caudoviricetes sp.]